MSTKKPKFNHLESGEIDLQSWYDVHSISNDLIKSATQLAKETSQGLTTFYGQPAIEQGLEMAEIVMELKLDPNAVAAAILTSTVHHTKLSIETIKEKLNDNIAELIAGVQQMETIRNLQKQNRDQIQIDRLRKLFLAMVSDIRVVIIKLAERTCIMRGIKNINPEERKHIAQETMDIFAPLANRLGIGHLKWELEDTAFHYADPTAYKQIAKFLAERRTDREQHIQTIIDILQKKLTQHQIIANITGRAKHIYSIYSKVKRKDTEYHNIYDYSAIRILVPTLQDCYTALSIVHSTWQHIDKEFDDYITNPKPNGYRSIHTAVIGPHEKTFEIQIRTFQMHEEAERGVAAHWVYKEGKNVSTDYESKVVFLRQLLDWHKDVAHQTETKNPAYEELLTDRVYIFTPAGDILDLPQGATPLDCAYHIHSEIGNHCRGAKINGHIVPLTYTLRTGDQIEILTNPHGTPSRDWLNSEFGYLKTPRARAKVAYWFRQQDLNQHIEQGRKILEREFSHLRIHPNLQKLATLLDLKDEDSLFAAVGRGNLRFSQVQHALETQDKVKTVSAPIVAKPEASKSKGMNIAGVSDLLTRIARCCKPIPGDAIIGFITQGRGVTIHKETCNNIVNQNKEDNNRLIAVSWDPNNAGAYYVDVQIRAHARDNLLKEVTTLLANAKINLYHFNSTINRNNLLIITLTIQINALAQLTDLINQINHLQGVIDTRRLSQ